MSQLGGAYYSPIQGNLPFAPGGNPVLGAAQLGAGLGLPAGAVQGLDTLAGQYGQSYQAALQQNQAMYNNILGGYQQLMGNQQAAQQPIIQGYNQSLSNIKGILGQNYGVPGASGQWGVAAPAAAAMNALYTQQTGQQFDSQGNPVGTPTGGAIGASLINRGLGNETVFNESMRGPTVDWQRGIGGLGAQLGQEYAGYEANEDFAKLNYMNQANMQNTALGQSQLNFMNSVQAGYPDPNAYNALFGQAGQMNQAQQSLALQRALMQGRNPFGPGGGAGGGAGGITYGPHANLNTLGGGFGPQNYGGGGGGGPYGPNTLQTQAMPPLGIFGGPGSADANAALSDPFALDTSGGDFSAEDPYALDTSGADFNAGADNTFAMDPTAIDPTMMGQGGDWTSGFGLGGQDFSASDYSSYS